MSGMNRRDWLKRAGLGSLASLGALNAGERSAQAIPPIGRTRPSHLKLSIAAYSYRDFLKSKPPKMDMFDFVSLAADMGLDAVEPTSYYFPENVDAEYLHRLKLHAFTLGLDISGTAVGNNFCLPPGSERDSQIEKVRTWIDRAAELDAPVIRIFAGLREIFETRMGKSVGHGHGSHLLGRQTGQTFVQPHAYAANCFGLEADGSAEHQFVAFRHVEIHRTNGRVKTPLNKTDDVRQRLA